MTDIVKWLAGVDWGRSMHQVCLMDSLGKTIGERSYEHGGSGLAGLCDWLLEKTCGRPEEIAVAIEVSHGPVVEALMERGFVLYAINPKQSDRFRDRFTMAGSKDDRFDARVLADALRTDRHRLHRIDATDPTVIELREWSRIGEELTQERVRLANRIQDQLWRYFPQALKLTDDVATDWFLEVWALAPTPAKAARIAEKAVAAVLKKHRVRRFDAAEVLRILKDKPLNLAAGTTEAASAHVRLEVARVKLVNQQLRDVNRQLDALSAKVGGEGNAQSGQPEEQRDVTILQSLPGIARIISATLLSEAYEPLQHGDYHALRSLCGVAPVTKQSGKSKMVLMRRACHYRLRNAVHHWARVAVQHDDHSRARYAALRKRGKSHNHALRVIADRLLRVVCAMLKTRTLYDPDHHRRATTDDTAVPSAA